MNIEKDKFYVISYKELKEKFKIKEKIEAVKTHHRIAETDDFDTDYGIRIGVW